MNKALTLQDMIMTLHRFWNDQGCLLMNPYDIETGAGTMNPMTTLRALGPEEWNVAYVEPSRRPADGRYGENPNRLYQHHQYQVILKPSPANVQELYLDSLYLLGIDPLEHDIRFVEDNWESPTLAAWGMGWEVWLDGMEVTQFTYFQQVGGLECHPVAAELTYGLERLATYLQNKENVFDIEFTEGVSYGAIFKHPEYEHSKYTFEIADAGQLIRWFDEYERESGKALERFQSMVDAQGGDPQVVENPQLLPNAPIVHAIPAQSTGYLEKVDAETIGRACVALGAGRKVAADSINPAVGMSAIRKIGEKVEQGEPLALIHANDADAVNVVLPWMSEAFRTSESPVESPPLISGVIEGKKKA